jgi:hypothetical protein
MKTERAAETRIVQKRSRDDNPWLSDWDMVSWGIAEG